MNDIEIRALYRELIEPAPDLETAAATRKQVADLACTVLCGLMAEDLKRRAEHGAAD